MRARWCWVSTRHAEEGHNHGTVPWGAGTHQRLLDRHLLDAALHRCLLLLLFLLFPLPARAAQRQLGQGLYFGVLGRGTGRPPRAASWCHSGVPSTPAVFAERPARSCFPLGTRSSRGPEDTCPRARGPLCCPGAGFGAKANPPEGFKLPSRVGNPGTEAAKGKPGPVPVTLHHLGHLEVLEMGKAQRGHQRVPASRSAGAGTGSPWQGATEHGSGPGAPQPWSRGCWGFASVTSWPPWVPTTVPWEPEQLWPWVCPTSRTLPPALGC